MGLSRNAKVGLYKSIVVPSLVYGSESWSLSARDRSRLEVVEMKCLRSICGLRRVDRVRNEEIRRRCQMEVSISERVEQNVLRWFGHMERMPEERVVKQVYMSRVEGVGGRSRPRRRWLDRVREYVEKRNVEWARARDLTSDRCEWRGIWMGHCGAGMPGK